MNNNQIYDLVYYCDSYPDIGNGHLSRAVKILNLLSQKNYKKIIKIGIKGKFSESAKEYYKNFLPKDVWCLNRQKDIRSKLSIIDTMFDPSNANYVDNKICDQIKMKSKISILISGILDQVYLPDSIDVFINHLPNVIIQGNINCEKYLGFKYTPVTKEFNNIDEKFGNDLLIVIGGNKDQSQLVNILKVLERFQYFQSRVNMVLSPHYPSNYLDKLKNRFHYSKLKFYQNEKSLVPLFNKTAAIICSYGNITYEALTYHLPTFTCSYKSFQNKYSKYLEQKGLVVNLGLLDKINFQKIELIESKNTKMELYNNSKKYFHNSGIENIVQIIERKLSIV